MELHYTYLYCRVDMESHRELRPYRAIESCGGRVRVAYVVRCRFKTCICTQPRLSPPSGNLTVKFTDRIRSLSFNPYTELPAV